MDCHLPKDLFYTLPAVIQDQWDALCEAHDGHPVSSLRIHPVKKSVNITSCRPIPWCRTGYYLDEKMSFVADPLWHAGGYYVQEASSMFLEQVFVQLPFHFENRYVLDLCAAPGGKSTLVSSLIEDNDLLVSNEVIQSRIPVLNENMIKWGQMNTWTCQNDPAHFSAMEGAFNMLLVDAPCSGSGLFRKKPAYREDWNTDLVHLSAERQKRILSASYPALARHGYLVYMTCSLSQQENEDIVDFLLQHFNLQSIQLPLPFQGVLETKSISGGWGYRLMPHQLEGEGFFLAVFQKSDGKDWNNPSTGKRSQEWFACLDAFVQKESLSLEKQGDLMIGIRPEHQAFYSMYQKDLRWKRRGIALGKILKNQLIPDHELAMFPGNSFKQRTALDYKDAIAYLRKEHFSLEANEKAWYLVEYEGVPLGWVKNLGNRHNNYYPSAYRILKQSF